MERTRIASHLSTRLGPLFTLTLGLGYCYIGSVKIADTTRLARVPPPKGDSKETNFLRQVVIENPILNSPYVEPTRHFKFTDEGITYDIVLKGFSAEETKHG